MDNKEKLLTAATRAAETRKLKKIVFSRASAAAPAKKVTAVPFLHKGERMVQFEETLDGGKVRHENVSLAALEEKIVTLLPHYAQVNVLTAAGDCEYRAKPDRDVALGADKLLRALERAGGELTLREHDREKQYILKGTEPFLHGLGISTADGRVHDKKQSKFRQINRFLEYVRDAETYLPKTGTLEIADLCCGKSYLSFAVYYYFTVLSGRTVRMTGVDLKADVVADCNALAKTLGFDGLTFIAGDVRAYKRDVRPHLVLSLHACDTATDLVIDKASAWGAEVILSTPCCHHALNRELNCSPLGFVAEHSMLRQKLCEAATDALRLKRLETRGYRVAAMELIDPDDTPKNILLKAIRKKHFDPASPEAKKLKQAYIEAYTFLTGKPISEPDF